MEPHLPNPNFTPEQSRSSAQTPEAAPSNPNISPPESAPAQPIEQLKSVETKERAASSPRTPVASTTLPAIAPPAPVPVKVADDDSTSSQTPSLAADDDVIEKEWVNKAKKVVSETKGDPYKQEHEVSKLQADYMQKRYGKHVKIPDDA